MYTGLVGNLGTVEAVDVASDGARLTVRTVVARHLEHGDSVAINGVCLTTTSVGRGGFRADVMRETLDRTSLGAMVEGHRVNVELPVRAAGRMAGHVVQGHVDCTGRVSGIEEDGFARRLTIAPRDLELLRHVVEKGSIAVDGVSLTVASVSGGAFEVSLVPETLERTTLGWAEPGTSVNLEVDVLARYVERLVTVVSGRPVPGA